MESTGPERLTLIERLVCSFRVPYSAGALLLALLLTAPVYFASRYVDSGDLSYALTPMFDTRLVSSNKFGLAVVNFVVCILIMFYPLYETRRMRSRLVQTEPDLRPLFSEGETTLHVFFGRVSNVVPSTILTVVVYVAILPFTIRSLQTAGAIHVIWLIISPPIICFIFGSFTWMFVSALWGLYKLGKEPIKLKTFLEDRMLGVGSFGSLSLSLAYSYIVFVGLGVLLLLTDPNRQFPLYVFLIFSLALLVGIALFFLPLVGVHGKMVSEKEKEWRKVREEMLNLLSSQGVVSEGSRDSMCYLASLARVEMSERALASTATWPFDTKVLEGLLAIVFSVVISILLSTVLPDILRI